MIGYSICCGPSCGLRRRSEALATIEEMRRDGLLSTQKNDMLRLQCLYNRSIAHTTMQNYTAAAQDVQRCLKIAPTSDRIQQAAKHISDLAQSSECSDSSDLAPLLALATLASPKGANSNEMLHTHHDSAMDGVEYTTEYNDESSDWDTDLSDISSPLASHLPLHTKQEDCTLFNYFPS